MKYDFYYSRTQEIRNKRLAFLNFGLKQYTCYINDQIYTEMITHGKKPLSKFDDLKFICTSEEKYIKIFPYEINYKFKLPL